MNAPDIFDPDFLLNQAYERALDGDQRAGHYVLVWLHNALRETGGATLTDSGRVILSEMLLNIINGEDARNVTFTRRGSGDPKWKRQSRNQLLVSEMKWRIKQDASKNVAAAAKDIANKGYFKKDNGDPMKWKTINNIYNDCKDNPDLEVVFFKDKD
jgi:hypothetical protein